MNGRTGPRPHSGIEIMSIGSMMSLHLRLKLNSAVNDALLSESQEQLPTDSGSRGE